MGRIARWSAGGIVWAAFVGAGFWMLLGYAGAAGRAANAPTRWPAGAITTRGSERGTLVMVVHPHCPCSRASLAELERLLARNGDLTAARVVFVGPVGGDLHAIAERIPGVTSVAGDAAEAARFGAFTSGQVLYYDADGVLRFSGGITSARGHEGDNSARDLLENIIRGSSTGDGRARVYGCPLTTGA